MENIIKYSEFTPIKEIIKDVLWQSYSKYSDLSSHLLEEEIEVVDIAIKQFAKEMGIMETKNRKLKMVCFEHDPAYIKFYNLLNDKYIDYDDLDEVDRRYIEIKIDRWLSRDQAMHNS